MWFVKEVKPPVSEGVEIWALKGCWNKLGLHVILLGAFIFLSTADHKKDPSIKVFTKAFFMSASVVLAISVIFTFVELYGLYKKNVKALKIWLFYAYAATLIKVVFWIVFCIWGFIIDLVVESLILSAVMDNMIWHNSNCIWMNCGVIQKLNEGKSVNQPVQEIV